MAETRVGFRRTAVTGMKCCGILFRQPGAGIFDGGKERKELVETGAGFVGVELPAAVGRAVALPCDGVFVAKIGGRTLMEEAQDAEPFEVDPITDVLVPALA